MIPPAFITHVTRRKTHARQAPRRNATESAISAPTPTWASTTSEVGIGGAYPGEPWPTSSGATPRVQSSRRYSRAAPGETWGPAGA